MKETYLSLMERALAAYSDAHIRRYFDDVRAHGLTEHGFPRLTVNLGILIAHGVRRDLTPLFLEMMEFCCRTIPTVKAANDFSVREIIGCLWELEASGAADAASIARWRGDLAAIEPQRCYSVYASAPTDDVRNWALFTAVSEFFRQKAGLCDSSDFIDLQLASQRQFLDANGMYRDNKSAHLHQPMVYDLVSRGLFSLLLHEGYRGVHAAAIDDALRRAAPATLAMQSVTGEVPFGGRSNQFLHNEAWLALIFEYEANRWARAGDAAQAARYKGAAARALASIAAWLGRDPIYHVKNRYPTETRFGCEKYAYFDKYMITTASILYAARRVCDDAIPAAPFDERAAAVFATSPYFHKIFLRAGGYALEWDTNADPHYDADGLGRVHRAGAPSAICLSLPCPSHPSYTVDLAVPVAASICPGIREDGAWRFALDGAASYMLLSLTETGDAAAASLLCRFADGRAVRVRSEADARGVRLTAAGEGELAWMLPAFRFDGAAETEIAADAHTLTVRYDGWICRYTAPDGTIVPLGAEAANRQGHYRLFAAAGRDALTVRIVICREGNE